MRHKRIACLGVVGWALLVNTPAFADAAEDTRTIGLFVQRFKAMADQSKAARDRNAVADTRNSNALEREAMATEHRTEQRLFEWQLAEQKNRTALLNTVIAGTEQARKRHDADEALQTQHQALLAGARSAANFQVAKLAEAASILVKLGEEQSLADQLKYSLAFSRETLDALQKDNTKAAAASDKANKSLTDKSDQLD